MQVTDAMVDAAERELGGVPLEARASLRKAIEDALAVSPAHAALDEIGRLAMACRMDMQGRLLDDQHKRAFDVLGSIVKQAAAALPD
jgi:hypothetical protein